MRTDNGDKLDLGFFGGGTLVQIGVSGVGSIREDNFLTNPDGSLFDLSGSSLGFFPYALSGASGYPSFNVGDGINHFVGGGLNLSTFNPAFYGFAGKQTTDTLDTLAIRFALVKRLTIAKTKAGPMWDRLALHRRLATVSGRGGARPL